MEAEEDALHIIAQKADGAMRDALSIFDQLVSFAGDKLTYETVIQNLNVLDFDYYFRMTDLLLNHDIPATLLLLNEIIQNGFDGQHFLIGLGEHLRNLLVCKNEATIALLEVSQSLKQRYLEQSENSSTEFLLKALETNNNCDLNYKTSNNKTLHLELALMQMCSINSMPAEEEKKNLTAEKNAKDKIQDTSRKIQDTRDKIQDTSRKIQDTRDKSQVVKEESPVSSDQRPVTSDQRPVTSDQQPVTSDQRPESKPNGFGNIPGTISIKKTREENGKKKTEVEVEEDLSGKPSAEFTQERLESVWTLFTESIKKKSPNLFATLTRNKPELKEDHLIELVIDNKVQEKEIMERRSNILFFLREELNNYQIQLESKIEESKEEKKAYLPEEIYQEMVKKNPNIKKLKDELDLELDY